MCSVLICVTHLSPSIFALLDELLEFHIKESTKREDEREREREREREKGGGGGGVGRQTYRTTEGHTAQKRLHIEIRRVDRVHMDRELLAVTTGANQLAV